MIQKKSNDNKKTKVVAIAVKKYVSIWLQDRLPIDSTPEEIAAILTDAFYFIEQFLADSEKTEPKQKRLSHI